MADECWLCAPGTDAEVVYTDVIGCGWCEAHYNETYVGDDE